MKTYRFAEFKVDPGSRELFSGDREIHLNDRAFDILLVLIEESPRVLSKDIIVDRVWDGVAVEDNSVERAIVSIRKALGEDTRSPKFIKTVRVPAGTRSTPSTTAISMRLNQLTFCSPALPH